MRRFLLFVLSIATLQALATPVETGYHPMLEVGKVWNYECVHYFLDDQGKIYYEKSPYKEWIEGDTIVNGVTYYKMHSSPLDFPVASESLWREDGCRVYCYGKTTKSEVLMYDFGLKTGDELSIMDFPFEVSRTDTILVNGTERKRILLNLGGGWKVNWVEGIGGEGLLAEPLGHLLSDGNVSRLLSCYKNDSCLFTASDFEVQGMTDAVHAITHDDGQSVVFYDLQGRRVQNKPAKGVYIRGGRKVVVK